MTRVLGVVLAGGQSRRFGSDKALALYRGRPLIAHAVEMLEPLVAAVVVSGGARPGYRAVADRPAPGLGPLGGLCGALAYAEAEDFDAVLTVPCDTPDLPGAVLERLTAVGGAACIGALPVAGYWPVALAADLLLYLRADRDRSMRAWARACGARAIETDRAIANVNRVADLDAASDRASSSPESC